MESAVNVRRFNDLIRSRVREVLLVSSSFDYFILQEDGTLTELVFLEYEELSLSSSPRFTHAATPEEALERLRERHFDLVLIMAGLEMDVLDFVPRAKQRRADLQIVLLNLDQRDPAQTMRLGKADLLDGVFLWTGDPKILLAIIKSVEDRLNVAYDVKQGNVRVIVAVEDSVLHYSRFLRVLYSSLMSLSRSLYSEGTSRLYRLMYMRSRPKLLLARSYEEATRFIREYQENLFALITDVRIPRGSSMDPRAGLELAREVREAKPYLPILIQSAEPFEEEAETLQAAFVDKNSATLLDELHAFLRDRLGFADFIFRLPDGTEVARAQDLAEMERALKRVPEESLYYHASQNHISIWLAARSEFELANILESQRADDFETVQELRDYVVGALRQARKTVYGGTVSDFRPERLEHTHFSRIGSGNMGGKARGIAFLNKLLAESRSGDFPMEVQSPRTIVISTQQFEQFLERNGLRDIARSELPDEQVAERFLAGALSPELQSDLRSIAAHLDCPLAVRSSSMLEDSMHQPFAGIYSTLMLPNNQEDIERRGEYLENAVKLVYASTYYANARSYLKSTGRRVGEERMAVIVQELIGCRYGNRYYPVICGVAQSHNFYPISPQLAGEGIVLVALGLGRFVVEGGMALRFSPKRPHVMPQFSAPKALLDSSQRGFWALPMRSRVRDRRLENNLKYYDLKAAEEDGSLALVGSVYSGHDEQIRDDLSLAGPRLITFNNILKHRAFPLAETLSQVLDMTREGFGGAVEIEFACDPGGSSQRGARGMPPKAPVLYLLQARPLAGLALWESVAPPAFEREDLLCITTRSLGQGTHRNLRDIVFVHPERWDPVKNSEVAREVGRINAILAEEKRPYILAGPGRWGSADPWLGIPVQWSQISAARVIIEVSPEEKPVAASQGTHFFHNITSLGIGYLTLSTSLENGDFHLDWDWLKNCPTCIPSQQLSHIRLDEPLTVFLDGRYGRATIAKPGARPIDLAV